MTCLGLGLLVAEPSVHEFSLACGTDGAYVDVTDDVTRDSIRGSWGRTSVFSDTRPGVHSFDFVNDTGDYTPQNSASSLATPVHVGMGVHHIVDGMQFAGTIRSAEPYFVGPASLAGSAKVRITCDDMLGKAARHGLSDLNTSTVDGATPYLAWPLDDDAGSVIARETIVGFPAMQIPGGDVVFGSNASHIPVPGTVARFGEPAGSYLTTRWPALQLPQPPLIYDTGDIGSWGFWVERDSTGGEFALVVSYAGMADTLIDTNTFNIRSFSGDLTMRPGIGTRITGPAFTPNTPFYCAVTTSAVFASGEWTITYEFFVNGVSYGSSDYVQFSNGSAPITSLTNADKQPYNIRIGQQIGSTGNLYASRLSHTVDLVNEYLVQPSTADVRLTALAATTPEVTLDTLPVMSAGVLAVGDTSGQSTLDAMNDVIRTEQGHIWAETTGALLAPDQKIKVRERDRPETVDAAHTFSITEIQNAPEFTTDIENMVYAATATGPEASRTAFDASLIPYVGSATDSSDVLLRDPIDLKSWAEDRLLRGAITDIRVPQFTVDAVAIDRWDDVSAIRAGDRVRVTGLPSAQLGIDYVAGWVLGGSYTLTRDGNGDYPDLMLFTFYLQPVLAATAIYDTDTFAADGVLTLTSDITSGATSASATSTGALLSTTEEPYTIRIGSECISVTTCTGASSPQSLTITRGATDPLTGDATTPAAHTAGDLMEMADISLYAF